MGSYTQIVSLVVPILNVRIKHALWAECIPVSISLSIFHGQSRVASCNSWRSKIFPYARGRLRKLVSFS